MNMGSSGDNKMVIIGMVVICLVTTGSLVTEVKAFDCMQVCKDACTDSKNAGKLTPALFDTCVNACPSECAHFGGGPGK